MRKATLCWPFAVGLLSFVCSTAAAAAPYSTMIVFGDSLADAGQFPDAGGPTGATLRFTNRTGPTYLNGSGEVYGLNSSTLLGGMLGVSPADLQASTSPVRAASGLADGNNWAVGGDRTDQILAAITTQSQVANADSATGVTTVLRTRPGYLLENNFRADPNALYYLTGGGNDFLQGRVLSAQQAVGAANNLAAGAQALSQAGARYIMVWLLPDIGQTPAVSGTPLQIPSTLLSGVFNQQLVNRLSQIDAEVIPLNVPGLIHDVLDDPARFGLAANQNLTGTCFSGNSCVANSIYGINGSTPDPTKLLFNDGVHPTVAGQRLIADYGYSILSAPWEITLLPEMANGTLRAQQDELRSQWLADWTSWQNIGEWRAIVAGGGQQMDFDSQSNSASADGHGYNLTLGGSYRFAEDWRAGLVAGAYRQTLEAGPRDSGYKLNSYLATAFVQFQANHWWADLAASAGKLDYDSLKRKFALGISEGAEKGNTDGNMWALSGRLGFDLAEQTSRWHFSPFISADYSRVEVDGYSENSTRSTALNYEDQTRRSKRLGAGVQGKFAITPQTQLFGEVAHEREFDTDQQDVTIALNSVPGVDFTLQGYEPQRSLNRASVGLSQKLAPDLTLRAGYNWRKNDAVTQQGINLALSLDF
ncbi:MULTISPECIES: esterase EstP [unclassified Pseudomonas]|uniref:esterase EstP n=1 Tax=unclassified Pseudomonas TaxID=196821 RepID=UPI0025D752F8|nr:MULTISPECIES: esterase EstP [unclassified Pseudomonas]